MANKQQTSEQRQRDIRVRMLAYRGGDEVNIMLASGLEITAANGRSIFVDPSKFLADIQHAAKLHGFKQKLVDAAAIPRDTKTGRSATVDEKFDAIKAVYDRLMSGDWNEEREGGGSGSYLLRALVEWKGHTGNAEKTEALKTWLEARTKEEKAALELNPAVKVIIDRMKADAAKAKAGNVDSDALLADMPE